MRERRRFVRGQYPSSSGSSDGARVKSDRDEVIAPELHVVQRASAGGTLDLTHPGAAAEVLTETTAGAPAWGAARAGVPDFSASTPVWQTDICSHL